MAKTNAKGRSKGDARHVRLYHAMMKSPAWRTLDPVARCAYVEIASRYGGQGSNNGRIPYSLRELAGALGTSKATSLRALHRLVEHGFIVQTRAGAFNVKKRIASEWRLTEYPCDVTRELATRAYLRWENQNTGIVVKPDGCSGETIRVST